MTRKGESITLSLDIPQQQELEKIALELGFTWGKEKGNISKLMRAIAEGEVELCVAGGDVKPTTSRTKRQIKKAISILGEVLE